MTNTPERAPSVAGFDPATLEAAGFPTIAFDRLSVGETFRSDERLVRPEDVETYAFAVDDHDPLFFEAGPFGHPVAHPTLLANQALFLRHSRYVVPAGLHARMTFEFLRPVPLGTRARSTGQVVDLYVRRDKPYMVTAYETSDGEGQVLTRGQFAQMLFRADTAPPPGTAPRPETEPAPARLDAGVTEAPGRSETLRAGQPLGPLARSVTQRQIDAYSGVRPRSIHTDEAWAWAKGFPTTIAQGMMSTGYVSTLATAALGAGFVAGGRMDVRFLRPVLCGDELTTTGTVAGFSLDEGRIRVHLDVTVVNQRGEMTLAGVASGLA